MQANEPFDVRKLEEDISDVIPRRQRDVPLPMPMLEQPQVSAEDLGRITAEAIKAAHESAASSLDKLGKEIAERIARIEQLKAQALQQIEDCKELAEKHRDAGKTMSIQVESAAADMAEARDMIEGMRKKIAR